MKVKKELPLAENENLCHLYLNYQNINSICFVEKYYKNFFFSNYLNCYSVNLDWFKFQYIPDDNIVLSNRFFETRIIDSTIFNFNLSRKKILNFIIQSINNNYYVNVYVDEFYLQNTLCYKTEHYPHEQLVYGYNLIKKEFKFLGIDKKGRVLKQNISFELFIESMFALQDDYFKQFQYDQIKQFPYFRLYKKKTEWVDFDIRIIVKQLEDYINGTDIFTLYATISPSISYLHKEHQIFSGINVYDNFANYINTLNNNELINIQFAYALLEHITIMKFRIQYIFKFGKNLFSTPKKKEIIEDFKKLIIQHSQLLNMCIMENLRFPKIKNRKNLQLLCNNIKANVLEFYKNIYKLIKDIDFRIIMNNNRFYFGVTGNDKKLLSPIN